MDLYDENQAAWWTAKEAAAREMTTPALWSCRLDCIKAAQMIPDRYGRYIDEACVYAAEIRRRGSNPNVLPEGITEGRQ